MAAVVERDEDVDVRLRGPLQRCLTAFGFQARRTVGARAAAGIAGFPGDAGDLETGHGAEQPGDVLAEIGHALVRVQQHPERHVRRVARLQLCLVLDHVFGDVLEGEAGFAVALERLADMEIAGRAPAQHGLGLEVAEAAQRAVGDAAAGRGLALPLGVDDAAAGGRAAQHLVIDVDGVEHVHGVEQQVRRTDGVAADIEHNRHLARRRWLEQPVEVVRRELHRRHQADSAGHAAEQLRRLGVGFGGDAVRQHQHGARIDALGAGRNAAPAAVALMRPGGGSAGQLATVA